MVRYTDKDYFNKIEEKLSIKKFRKKWNRN